METLFDRLEREHPEFIGPEYPGGFAICPVDVGYERASECPWANKEADWDSVDRAGCYECWNRPIPGKGAAQWENGLTRPKRR